MSAGSKVTPIRIPDALLREVLSTIVDSNDRRAGESWTLSEFIRVAIREKLDKMQRSRNSRRKKKGEKPTEGV